MKVLERISKQVNVDRTNNKLEKGDMKMNNLQTPKNRTIEFMYEGNNSIRTVLIDEEVWFVAKDVCDVLEVKNTTIAIKRLDEDEVTKFNLGGLIGEVNIINESGLYSLIMSSRKPEAKRFRRWITNEVIPSIHKHGAYITPDKLYELISNPDVTQELLSELVQEREKVQQLAEQLDVLKPKAELYDEMFGQVGKTIDLRDTADFLSIKGMGRNNLANYLREKGMLTRFFTKYDGNQYYVFNRPSRKYIERGWFDVVPFIIDTRSGKRILGLKTLVTQKGLIGIRNSLINAGYTVKTKGRLERFSA